MAIKKEDGWHCSYCDRIYDQSTDADVCLENHNLIYIPISREDLKNLIQFIYLKASLSINEGKLLTPTLMKTLQKYNKFNFTTKNKN